MKWKRAELTVQFLKFSLVGIGNGVVYFVLYYLLLQVGVSYLLANVLAWAGSVFHSFFGNRRYVFLESGAWWQVLLKTYASYGISLVVGLLLLFFCVEQFGISEVWAPWIATVFAVPLNFLLNKIWVFAK